MPMIWVPSTVSPNPRTKPYWAFIALVLTVSLCLLMTLVTKQAEQSYTECRAQDTLYQTNRRLSKALFEAYVIQITMMQDQKAHPLPPERRSY